MDVVIVILRKHDKYQNLVCWFIYCDLSYVVESWSEITPCIKIDKTLSQGRSGLPCEFDADLW